MFDLLTREQLSQYHEILALLGRAIFRQLFDADYRPAIPTDSVQWHELRIKQITITDEMGSVYAEMQRRDQQADDLPGRIGRALEEDAGFDGVGEAERNTENA